MHSSEWKTQFVIGGAKNLKQPTIDFGFPYSGELISLVIFQVQKYYAGFVPRTSYNYMLLDEMHKNKRVTIENGQLPIRWFGP